RQAKHTLFSARRNLLAQVEKWGCVQLASCIGDSHEAATLDNEQTVAVVRWRDNGRRLREPLDDRCQGQVLGGEHVRPRRTRAHPGYHYVGQHDTQHDNTSRSGDNQPTVAYATELR